MTHKVEGAIGGGKLTLETGRLAEQANRAVTVRYEDTIVLVTVCAAKEPREGFDFVPLTVDYEERLYAAGKIPGGFLRRESRSQQAILAARLTDRPIRPLFPKGFRNEVQLVITVLSADQENTPEVPAIIGASSALTLSNVPFAGPIGAVRVGYINGEYVLNPTFSQLHDSLIDLVVCGTKETVIMVEGDAAEVSHELIIGAIKFGQGANQEIITLQEQLQSLCGSPKMEFAMGKVNPELETAIVEILNNRISNVFGKNKHEREKDLSILKEELIEKLGETYSHEEISAVFESKVKSELRTSILERGFRADGRGITDVRPIICEVGLLPRTHGSGLFSRGLTQVLNITTLGTAKSEQHLDGLSLEETKRFMHHYNFPPFSTGEVKRLGAPGRREIGHGALVERALAAVIPEEDVFPYTVRLVSEVLSSNGSTSMASVCSGSLSLMDAGVPIKAPVAGVAMGLITNEAGRYVVLTDIEGMEDFYGDMDFKVAGTASGITAIQMDTKIKGLSFEMIEKTLDQAYEARLFILGKMQETINSTRPELSRYAPRIIKMNIDPSKIGTVIGPGGKVIRSIIEQTKTTVDIDNGGIVLIGSTDEEAAQKAIKMIEDLTKEVEVGTIYTGKVTRIFNYGALVEVLPGKEGLVHISELADYRVPSVEDVIKLGDEIMVKVIEIDRQGKISLSRRAVFQGQSNESSEGSARDSSGHGYNRRPHSTKSSSQYGTRRREG
jgi:polyribonucleotide nucleotidyltransferase